MKILITGCAGFIGFHLCEKILKTHKKYKIVGIDNLNNYYSVFYKKKRLSFLKDKKNFQFHKIDISNFKKLEEVFKKNKFDFVINLAAQAGVRYSISNPKEYMYSNILGFFNIIELSRIYKIKKIYYASSSSVYGESKKFPIKETTITHPKNIYSLSKKNNEEIAEIYSRYYNIQFIGFRFFTIYGEWGRPDMLILKYILKCANKDTFYLNNYGNHYRDFTYVKDVVENILRLTGKKIRKRHEIFNICSNNPVSIKWVLDKISKEFGAPKIIKKPKQNADVYKTHGNNKKINKITKFKNYTKISKGLNNVIEWAKLNIQYIK
jgi:UDP-glucuronate 4-epimerase